jgi:hypothetical protein
MGKYAGVDINIMKYILYNEKKKIKLKIASINHLI